MATKAELMAEAYRRGLLPPEKRAAYEEAMRRGIIAGPERKRSLTEDVTGFMANVNRGLGIGDEIAAGGQTVVNALAGRVPVQNIAQDFRRNMAAQRQTEDRYSVARPRAAALGRGTGNALAAVVPGGNTAAAFANSARGVNALRGATTGALAGAGYAAVDRGTARERLAAAANPATLALSAAGGAVGGALAPARPRPVRRVDPNVEILAREGVQMTPGQMRGGLAKAAEDAATSLPIVGDAIQESRRRGVESFNQAVVNRTLNPFGESLPEGIEPGSDAIRFAGDRLSQGYDDLLPEGGMVVDDGLREAFRELGETTQTLTPEHRERLRSILESRVISRLQDVPAEQFDNVLIGDGPLPSPTQRMDGETYKHVQSELKREAARFKKSLDVDLQDVGAALESVSNAMQAAAGRQNPQFASRLSELDAGWAQLVRAENAAKNTPDGVFTPLQYDRAVRAATATTRGRGAARGEALGQDLSRAARDVLPSTLPDSGTARRGLIGMAVSAPGAAIGGGLGGVAGAVGGVAATGATLGAASRLYTPQAIQAANVALNARISDQERRIALQTLQQLAAENPEVQQLFRDVMSRLPRAAGVGSAQLSAQ